MPFRLTHALAVFQALVNDVETISFLGYIIVQGSWKLYPIKVEVVNWPDPKDRKQLQCFSNVYQTFIRDFNKITNLPKDSVPVGSSCRLKEHFASAPILAQLDLGLQFIIEVRCFHSRVGDMVSQQKVSFTHGLFSLAFCPLQDPNYDVGHWEILAIKLALEEWRH